MDGAIISLLVGDGKLVLMMVEKAVFRRKFAALNRPVLGGGVKGCFCKNIDECKNINKQ
jgi:hypothetical protein